jgi:hypothetical protein
VSTQWCEAPGACTPPVRGRYTRGTYWLEHHEPASGRWLPSWPPNARTGVEDRFHAKKKLVLWRWFQAKPTITLSSWCVLCSVSPSLNVSSITIEQPIEENGAILKKVSGSMHGNLLWAQAWMFHTLCSRMSASQKTSSLKTLQPSTHADTWQRQPSAWTLLPLFTGIFTNNSRSEKQ